MAADEDNRKEQEYQVIQEQIVRRRKPKWKKRLAAAAWTVCFGVLFGVVARYAFLVSDELLVRLFGLETEKKQEVTLSETQTPLPTKTPTSPTVPSIEPTPTPTKTPERTPTPTPDGETGATAAPVTGTVTVTPSATGEEQGEITGPAPTNAEEITPPKVPEAEVTESALEAQVRFYEELRALAKQTKKAFATVTAIESGVDWFDAAYEKRSSTTGIILGSNGIDLLVLVNLADIKGADSIEVMLLEKVVCTGTVFSYDSDFSLAVIAVKLEELSDEEKAEISFAKLAVETPESGTPVLMLGSLNGHPEAMEFGMLTSADGTVSSVDHELTYFTTDIAEYESANGFLVNLSGEILGMVTHTIRGEQDSAVLTAVSIIQMQQVLQSLLNKVDRVYCGVKLTTLPESILKKLSLKNGVYVSEVENASPALLAGLKNGDIIVALDKTPMKSVEDFTTYLSACQPKQGIDITIVRSTSAGTKEVVITVILEKKTK